MPISEGQSPFFKGCPLKISIVVTLAIMTIYGNIDLIWKCPYF